MNQSFLLKCEDEKEYQRPIIATLLIIEQLDDPESKIFVKGIRKTFNEKSCVEQGFLERNQINQWIQGLLSFLDQ